MVLRGLRVKIENRLKRRMKKGERVNSIIIEITGRLESSSDSIDCDLTNGVELFNLLLKKGKIYS